MSRYWLEVRATGLSVPSDRPLGDLTAELARMLGDPDPDVRDGIAYPTLATWIQRGVYDDLLPGLGDGMASGLAVGLGERDTDTVFRRSYSALVLSECIARDNSRPLVPGGKVPVKRRISTPSGAPNSLASAGSLLNASAPESSTPSMPV